MMALMRRMMLTCEEATFLSTKKIIDKVGLRENMGLQMHLAACKHCKRHYLQTKMITRNVRHFSAKATNGSPLHRMSPAEKSKLQKLVSNKIQSN